MNDHDDRKDGSPRDNDPLEDDGFSDLDGIKATDEDDLKDRLSPDYDPLTDDGFSDLDGFKLTDEDAPTASGRTDAESSTPDVAHDGAACAPEAQGGANVQTGAGALGQPVDVVESDALDVITEPRCKACALPSDLRDLLRSLRFEQGLSNARVAFRMNDELARLGLATRLSPRGLSSHFARHGREAERFRNVLRTATTGAKELTLMRNAMESLALLADPGVRSLHDDIVFVGTSLAEAFEDLLTRVQAPGPGQTRPAAQARDLVALAQLGKSVLAAAESSRRLLDPVRVAEVVRDVALRGFVVRTGDLVCAQIGVLTRELSALVPADRQKEIHERVNALGVAFEAGVKEEQQRLCEEMARALAALRGTGAA